MFIFAGDGRIGIFWMYRQYGAIGSCYWSAAIAAYLRIVPIENKNLLELDSRFDRNLMVLHVGDHLNLYG